MSYSLWPQIKSENCINLYFINFMRRKIIVQNSDKVNIKFIFNELNNIFNWLLLNIFKSSKIIILLQNKALIEWKFQSLIIIYLSENILKDNEENLLEDVTNNN